MLSVKLLRSADAAGAASYYEGGPGHPDEYYAAEGEARAWLGAGAARLDLAGPVAPARFRELLRGEVRPGESARHSTRHDARDRLGIDLTFSAPKSVSIQALVGGDAAVLRAHDAAVAHTIAVAERLARARAKEGGIGRVETTGNLIVAAFRHETSREGDPQLHTHAVVLNITQRADGAWRALANEELLRHTRVLGATYRSELAHALTRAGYGLTHGRDGMFELSHIPEAARVAFSARSRQVEAHLATVGLDREHASTAAKQAATLATRAPKGTRDREALQAEWRARARALGVEFGARGPVAAVPEHVPAEAARAAVRHAVRHLTEREAVVARRTLLGVALEHAAGAARLPDLAREVARLERSGALLARTLADGSAGVTTTQALTLERQVLRIEREGRAGGADRIAAAHARLAGTRLDAEQRAAAALVVGAGDRVVGVAGRAGTGKSLMLAEARRLLEADGARVETLAPYGAQVRTLRAEGMPARTVAAFLRERARPLDARSVLIVDEAGVLPTRQLAAILGRAEAGGARVVLVGDTRQTQAIEAGRPFDQLQAAGMRTAALTTIRRQRDPELKRAVEAAAGGAARASLAHLPPAVIVADGAARRARIVADWLALPAADRERTLILSGTNAARRDLNQRVREALGLAGAGVPVTLLVRRDTTRAERQHARSYAVGDVVQPERDLQGLRRGGVYRVTAVEGASIELAAPDGAAHRLDPRRANALSVYRPEAAELSVGDVVRVTRNDAGRDLANGDRLTVTAVDRGAVTLSDGRRRVTMPAGDALHVDYGWAGTVHGSQGRTVDRVLVDIEADRPTTGRRTWYVAISRARWEARVYADRAEGLPEGIERDRLKTAALDRLGAGRASGPVPSAPARDRDRERVLER